MQHIEFSLDSPLGDGLIPCSKLSADSPAISQAALLVVPSVFGVDGTFLLHCERLTAAGFVVYAMDNFWRDIPGPLSFSEANLKLAMQRMANLQDPNCDSDVATVCQYIRREHPNLALIGLGICFGGRPIVKCALEQGLDGVAAWHGVRIDELGKDLAALSNASLHFGSVDAWTPTEHISAIMAHITPDKSGVSVHVHDGCDHGFTHLDRPAVFNEAAYQLAFRELCELA